MLGGNILLTICNKVTDFSALKKVYHKLRKSQIYSEKNRKKYIRKIIWYNKGKIVGEEMEFRKMKKIVNVFINHLLYQVTYEGMEIIEELDRCLLCPNHSNIFDPCFLFPKVDNFWIMAKSEIFKNPIIAKVLTYYQVIPIEREKRDVKGTRKALQLLKKDKIHFLLFPEGGILKEERGKNIKDGAIMLAAVSNIPIVPISITQNPRLFSKVHVKIHEPILISKTMIKEKDKLKEQSLNLLNTIYQK